MSGRIITLFGEEFAPEEQKPAAKGKGRKKAAAADAEASEAEEPQPATIDVVPVPGASVTDTPAPFPAGPVSIAEGEPYAAPSIAGEVPATPAAETYTEPEPVAPAVDEVAVTPVTFEEPAFTAAPVAEPVADVTAEYTEEPAAPEVVATPPAVFEEPVPAVTVSYAEEPAPQADAKPEATITPAEDKKVITKKSKRTPKEEVVAEAPADANGPSQNIPENWEGDKTYYTIGEVAALFNVKTSHIRFWTNEFKIRVRTTRKGDRLYTPAQVKEIRVIYHLVKERGFTLAGAKARLKTQNNKDTTTVDLKESLKDLRAQLAALRDSL